MRRWFCSLSLSAAAATLVVSGSCAQALPAEEPVAAPSTLTPKAEAKSPSAPAAASSSNSAAAPYSRPSFPITLDLRYGLPLTSQEPDVRSHWEHDIWGSYLSAVGAYWESPRIIYGDWWFFTGPEFIYEHNNETLDSGLGHASLTTETMTVQLNGGLTWQPKFFGRQAGAQLAIGLPLWANKSSKIDADGFSRDLGSQKVTTLGYQLNFFYEFDHHWRPFLGYETRTSSNISLGLNYAF